MTPTDAEALALASCTDTAALTEAAGAIRDRAFGTGVTYSKKVFIPLTHLCRDVCHYCTFAQAPRTQKAPFMTMDEVLDVAKRGAELGCKEALFTLGERPELRYPVAREALATMGYETTLEYLHDVAGSVLRETGLLPHLNPGTMSGAEIGRLRGVSASMGLMLESASDRLCGKGMPASDRPTKSRPPGFRRSPRRARRRSPSRPGFSSASARPGWSGSNLSWPFARSTSAMGTCRRSSSRTSGPSPIRRWRMRRSPPSTSSCGRWP